jgi:hypothetical protein
LPIVPSTGLIFAGAAIAAAGAMNMSQPRVAAVVVIGTLFSQIMGIAIVGFPWLMERFRQDDDSTAPLQPVFETAAGARLSALEDIAADY